MRKRIYGIGVPILMVAGYVGYWHYLESELQRFVGEWIEDQRAAGVQVTHGDITTGGFPLTVYADIPAPGITGRSGQDSVTWQGETLRISFPPWDFLTYSFDSPGEHLIAIIGAESYEKWSMNAERVQGSWAIKTGGGAVLQVDLGGVEVEDVLQQAYSVDMLALAIDIADENAPAAEPRVTVSADVAMLTIPEAMTMPMAPVIERFQADLALEAPVLPANLPILWLILRDYDGQLVVHNSELAWGELEIIGEGTLQVDANNYAIGSFPLQIAGYQDTIQRMEDAGFLGGLEAVGLRTVAGAMARSDDGGTARVPVIVDLIDGLVKIQEFTVMRLQPLPVPGAQI